MTTVERSTPEAELGAVIDAVRRLPDGRDELVALLPEHLPIYEGRSAAEMGRLRGYLLAAFAETGLPDAALPYVIESLETGHIPYEVAGAAIGLRGAATPSAGVETALLRAFDNLGGADVTVSFECYRPVWPYARPTTALTEVVRTIGHFGARAEVALAGLEHLVGQRDRFSGSLLAAMRRVLDEAGSHHGVACGRAPAVEPATDKACCADVAAPEPAPVHAALRVVLEDQDGRTENFEDFFRGKPSVVAFFYTRCDNPYKCSLTVTKLAALVACLEERRLAGAVRVAAITYDPEFDLPHRLRRYGIDRGMRFGADTRFFRAASGFEEIRRRFALGVNYGTSTVNRHRTEVYVLDERGDVSAAFSRTRWQVEAVLTAVVNIRQH